jgi:hypothetical protein
MIHRDVASLECKKARSIARFFRLSGFLRRRPISNLRFVLRYEPITLDVYLDIFQTLESRQREDWIRYERSSIFAHRGWYLYEVLTGRQLNTFDATSQILSFGYKMQLSMLDMRTRTCEQVRTSYRKSVPDYSEDVRFGYPKPGDRPLNWRDVVGDLHGQTDRTRAPELELLIRYVLSSKPCLQSDSREISS